MRSHFCWFYFAATSQLTLECSFVIHSICLCCFLIYCWRAPEMFPCYWTWIAMALNIFFYTATLQNLIVWNDGQGAVWAKPCSGSTWTFYMCLINFCADHNSVSASGWGPTDRRCSHMRRCWHPKVRCLWEAPREQMSIGMETQVYFFDLPKCRGESAWETERRRDRPGHFKASVCSSDDSRPKQFRAVQMGCLSQAETVCGMGGMDEGIRWIIGEIEKGWGWWQSLDIQDPSWPLQPRLCPHYRHKCSLGFMLLSIVVGIFSISNIIYLGQVSIFLLRSCYFSWDWHK